MIHENIAHGRLQVSQYTDESGEVVGTILTAVLRGVASIFGSAYKATCSCSVLVLVSFSSIFAI